MAGEQEEVRTGSAPPASPLDDSRPGIEAVSGLAWQGRRRCSASAPERPGPCGELESVAPPITHWPRESPADVTVAGPRPAAEIELSTGEAVARGTAGLPASTHYAQ